MTAGTARVRAAFATAVLAASTASTVFGMGLAVCLAQSYPEKPIRIVVPFSPGGPPDVGARLIGEWISARLGPVVIENKPGAGGTIASRLVAAAPPDGYTLMLGTAGSLAVSPALYKNPGYDPVKDFSPVAFVARASLIVAVNASMPVNTIGELVGYAKSNPGTLNFGAVTGTPPHLAGLMFAILTNTNIMFVPYKGATQATTDVVAGQIHMTIEGISGIMPFVQAAKVKPLAITGPHRNAQLPQVPTIVESGLPDIPAASWTCVVAPAGTPEPIVKKLNAVINEGLASPELQAKFAKLGADLNVSTPQEFGAFLVSEVRRWAEVVKITGATID
jgi:tripartite-type tricarboxylate transporter receptor subunit TctC